MVDDLRPTMAMNVPCVTLPTGLNRIAYFSMKSIKSYVALLVLSVSSFANAQVPTEHDESLVRGRAAYSPAMTLALLKKMEKFCASADKAGREQLFSAVAAWEKRHQVLLQENARVRDELRAEVEAPEAPAGLKAELNNMLNIRVPQQVENDFKRLFPPAASKGWASKAFTCGANAGVIDSGQYDLERNDPELSAYLRKRFVKARADTATPE
jgi:hypothetical protein